MIFFSGGVSSRCPRLLSCADALLKLRRSRDDDEDDGEDSRSEDAWKDAEDA